jgi:hypothetical protein
VFQLTTMMESFLASATGGRAAPMLAERGLVDLDEPPIV